jgi:MoaA/NifB/PqqE/SkfB family radical SAM enzyme
MATQDPTQPSADNAEESHATKGLLRLTMACNEQCPFCNVPQEDYKRPTPDLSDTETELAGFIERGDRTLTISGGEPTLLRKRLLGLCVKARAGGVLFIEVQTNAILIDQDYAQDLANAGVTSAFVSLLSHVPEHHDTLAGLEGAFEKCLQGIDSLLDSGIRVTLNPVTARLTQTLVCEYIDFVATRLPRVRSVSMSAVQPHGRARDRTDLLPDYDILAEEIRNARSRAKSHEIELINPYCGLPLCVGWEDGLDVSVEAIEATIDSTAQGLDNHGNKDHGPPCMDCTLRSRCGGAWHSYWSTRGGAGIHPPSKKAAPWADGNQSQQHTEDAKGGISPEHWARLAGASTPTRWLWTDDISLSDLEPMRKSGVTDLAVSLELKDLPKVKQPLSVIRKLIRSNQLTSPQNRILVHLVWPTSSEEWTAQCVEDAIDMATAIGVHSFAITGADAERHAHRLSMKDRAIACGVFPPS